MKRVEDVHNTEERRSHFLFFFFFSSRRRHTRWNCDWSSDVCSSDLVPDSDSAETLGADCVRNAARPAIESATSLLHRHEEKIFVERDISLTTRAHQRRSEERRVGKECRSRWSRDHEKKKRKEKRGNR